MTPTRHCLAYSQRTGDLAAHTHSLGGTLLYFPMRCGTSLAVGDPLADSAQQVEPLLDCFLRTHPRASFIQCSEWTARLLQKRGFFANSFGIETDLVLGRWNCSGKRAHMLRKNFNKADRVGVEVVEITANAELLETARSVSERWLNEARQKDCELRLLTRPPVFTPEPGTRKFASFFNGKMVGIGFFDPLCLADPGSGYVYQLLRESPGAPAGTGTHLLLSVAEKFRAGGIERLSLGLSPNYLAAIEPLTHSQWTRRILEFSRKLPWYNYQGQQFYKSRFCGDERTVFVATRARVPLRLLFNVAVETGIFTTLSRRHLTKL